jgi:Ca2+:H+ antiporter
LWVFHQRRRRDHSAQQLDPPRHRTGGGTRGPAIGGLVNVTFGNAAEFILALFVLRSGNVEVVKATITGAIIGNSLLGLGASILVGSWGRARQTFDRNRAGLLASC